MITLIIIATFILGGFLWIYAAYGTDRPPVRLPLPSRPAPPMPTCKPPMQHEGKHYNLIDRDILRLLMVQGSLTDDEIKDLLIEGRISVNDIREAEAKRSHLFGVS